jgi:hypothetical protein
LIHGGGATYPAGYPKPIDLRPIQPQIATISPARDLKRFALIQLGHGRAFGVNRGEQTTLAASSDINII